MAWWCRQCARRMFSKRGCNCVNPEAERIPRLDGFIALTADGYTLTEEDELELRREWFQRKRDRMKGEVADIPR